MIKLIRRNAFKSVSPCSEKLCCNRRNKSLITISWLKLQPRVLIWFKRVVRLMLSRSSSASPILIEFKLYSFGQSFVGFKWLKCLRMWLLSPQDALRGSTLYACGVCPCFFVKLILVWGRIMIYFKSHDASSYYNCRFSDTTSSQLRIKTFGSVLVYPFFCCFNN